MIIAIDGTTASGKGTLAKRIAAHYGLRRLDSGAIYRAVALAVLDHGGDPSDPATAEAAARALDLGAIDEGRIRTGPVGAAASVVAAIPAVRAALLDAQRAFARAPGGAVIDGRDIGTVVCPDADVKFYVIADLSVRAERRWKELMEKGETITLKTLTSEIAARDKRDAERPVSPMKQALDAHLLDTTSLSIEAAAAAACRIIDAVLHI